MRLRNVLVLGAVGLAIACWTTSLFLGYLTVFGCCLLTSLRHIDLHLGDLKGRIEKREAFERHALIAYGFADKDRERILLQAHRELVRDLEETREKSFV